MLEDILNSDHVRALGHALQDQKSILVEHLWNAPKALVAALAVRATGKHVLILTGGSQEEVRLFHDFAFFCKTPVVDFPAWETLPSESVAPSPDIVGERYRVLQEIRKSTQPHIILSGLQACLQKLIPPKQFEELYLELKTGDNFPYELVIEQLNEMGYQRRSVASDKGEYAVRGGIIDVFPVSSPDPFRLEFWGDDVESIRIYDPIGQKSVRTVKEVRLTPAQELELLRDPDKLSIILDYLGPSTLVIFDDLLALEDKYASLLSMGGGASNSFSSIEVFLDRVQNLQKIFWSAQPIEELSEVALLERKAGFYSDSGGLYKLAFSMFNRQFEASQWRAPFFSIADYLLPDFEGEPAGKDITAALGKLEGSDVHLHVLCGSELEESSFQKRLLEQQITLPAHTHFHIDYLSSGLVLPQQKLVILPLTEITQRYKIRRQKQRSTYHTVPVETYDLSPGEMVVHLNNGIGKFLGIEKQPNHTGTVSEFFAIEYADKAKLYVPMNQAYMISKYIGSSEELPKLHTLGSNRWKKAKESTERAILTYAADLLNMYAHRELKGGFSCPEDGADFLAFEENFPYVETEDQLAAIASIKQDMKSPKSMDRLVCGDVGYGKTEVAMRAAFKAVVDGGRQVAVLVPTTVLAMQHYENFVERMSHFPIEIGVVSRFRTPKQVRETLKKAQEGSIDILIGTHRLISDDVQFKDLGLVIVDEEQRFGVKVKEHLKKLKIGVDCLTMSATPIPRTLYMSLVGARDMSVINTPPQDRLPITTVITEPNELVMKNALLRELSRDGQAYVIHNRVETIYEYASHIQKMLPHARIVVGHGQMSSDEIDRVFHAFKSGQADILVATTIVENGIDIPNANTILIDRADHFGIADLYQLRGRVGRWNRRAYAYFLVKNIRGMPEISRKRLMALAESSGYGGGMKVAMRDLEIRGAGNILGFEQSGHVSSIGFHLYCKMLKRAIKALQGEIPSTIVDVKMEFPADARLPEEYINEVGLRMEIYQRMGEALSWDEVDGIWGELKDRFGKPPEPAQWLYHMTRIRVYAALNGYTLLKQEKLSLYTEQQKGKNQIVRKVAMQPPKCPEEFEAAILKILSAPTA